MNIILLPFTWLAKCVVNPIKEMVMQNPIYCKLGKGFNRLSKFYQDVFIAFTIGMLAYGCLYFAQNLNFIKDTKNTIFDSTLVFFTDYSNKDKYIEQKPILIALDEQSMQDKSWMLSSEKAFVMTDALRLVDYAFKKGSRHVFLDMSFEKSDDNNNIALVKSFIEKHKFATKPLHLYVVLPTQVDACMPSVSYHTRVLPNVWDKVPLHEGNLYIHPVAPSYIESSDKAVRFWSLYSVYQYQQSPNAASQWVFLPSPQLAYHVVSTIEAKDKLTSQHSLSQLPWLNIFQIKDPNLIPITSRHIYTDTTYKKLIELSDSENLKRFCDNDTTCIRPDYVKNSGNNNSLAKTLIGQLADESTACIARIESFANSTSMSSGQYEIMENRIVYSMKSWQETSSYKQKNYELFTPLKLLNATEVAKPDKQKTIVVPLESLAISEYKKIPLSQQNANNRLYYPTQSWQSANFFNEKNYKLLSLPQYLNVNQHLHKNDEQPIIEDYSLLEPWDNQVVAIGSSYLASRDANYLTPIGNMPGVLINLNAMVSFDTFGPIGLLPPLEKFLLNVLIIFIAAFIFAKFRAKTATFIMTAGFVLFILFFYLWMFKHGIWIEFGLPLLVITIAQWILEIREDRQIDKEQRQLVLDKLEKENQLLNEQKNRLLDQQKLKEAEQKIELTDTEKRKLEFELATAKKRLQELVQGTAWDAVEHGGE